MLTAVHLDDQGSFSASEISKVTADWKLADELVAGEPTSTQQLPQFVLSFGLSAAKRARPRS